MICLRWTDTCVCERDSGADGVLCVCVCVWLGVQELLGFGAEGAPT